jgi:chromosome segregation ATPase
LRSEKPRWKFSLIVILLCLLFFLISVGGLIAIWVVNEPLTREITVEIEAAQADLADAATTIQTTREELESLQGQIDIFQGILDSLGTDAIQNASLLADVVNRVESNISPLLDRVSNGVNRIQEAFDSIKETISQLNNLPLVSIELPGESVLDTVSESLGNLQQQISDTKSQVESVSQITQDTVDTLTSGFETWEEFISQNKDLLDQYEIKVTAYQARLAYLDIRLPQWIDYASVVLTMLLVWLAISQVGLFILAWQFYKGRDLLARWRKP